MLELFIGGVPGSRAVRIEIENNKTILDLKAQVAEVCGIPVENIKIIANGPTEDQDNLCDIDFTKGTIVRVGIKGEPDINFEIPRISYETRPLPEQVLAEKDSHNYRILCKGTPNKTHDVSKKKIIYFQSFN